jgi:hypothetical protein
MRTRAEVDEREREEEGNSRHIDAIDDRRSLECEQFRKLFFSCFHETL